MKPPQRGIFTDDQLAEQIDWDWIDAELADCFSDEGRPGLAARFMVGLLLLKQIQGLSDEEVCARCVETPLLPVV